jgi:RNA polymerase sigma-70 factor, ECF subfamily
MESDGRLIARLKDGDGQALQALYARHNVKIYRFVLRLIRDEGAAEDVVSEVFIDLWRNPAAFEGRSEASTWLMAIARNKAWSLLRKRKEAEIDEGSLEAIADESDDPEVEMQKKTKAELLRACLAKLSAEHREVIDLVYYHEKSIEDVAAIIGIPEGTVKTRMFHARKKLSDIARAAGVDRGWP